MKVENPFDDTSRFVLMSNRFDSSALLDVMAEDEGLRPLVEGIRAGQRAAQAWLDGPRDVPVMEAFIRSVEEQPR